MKIVYLVPNVDGMGGTSRAVLTQAHALSARHEIEILSVFRTAERPHYDLPAGVRVRYLSSTIPGKPSESVPPSLLDPHLAESLQSRPSLIIPGHWDPTLTALGDAGLEQWLPKVRGDVLVTVTPGLLAAAAQLAPSGMALVHQEHRASSQRTAGLEPLLVFGPRADAVVLLTQEAADWLGRQWEHSRPQLEVVPNALPPGFRPTSTLDNPLIVSAGRFVAEKQFTHLIRAFGQIADELPDWRLRIHGSGPHRPRMVKVIRKSRLFDRVELPGNSTTMAAEWAHASIAALTSRTEGLPLIVQEAMAAGVPVASYDCPSGPRELIDHERNGLLVAPGSETAMAQALLRLATDHSLRHRMGAASLEASTRFEPDRIAAQWEAVFSRAVSTRDAVRRLPRTTARAVMTADQTNQSTKPDSVAAPRAAGTRTPEVAAQQTLERALAAAEAAGDDWFVIPGGWASDPVVVVPDVDRRRFFEALGEEPSDFLSLRLPESTSGWNEERGELAAMAAALARAVPERVVLEPSPESDERPGLNGQGCAVTVEFWVQHEDRLTPVRDSDFKKQVRLGEATARRVIRDVSVPTLPSLAAPYADECLFPIDAVFTWVDGSDETWLKSREQALAVATGAPRTDAASGRARYADNGELRYALRSIHLFAPWIRTIHLVTAGQVPAWLDVGHPRIRMVDHGEILHGDALPTFNSHAIETGLHRVPDLTEQYIYFNDDVFLARPVRPELFFSPDGRPAMFRSEETIGPEESQAPPYLQAAYHNRRLLERDFGRSITHTLAHTPHPQRRSLVEEVVERYRPEVTRTSLAPFRSSEDVSLTSSLVQHYGLLTGGSWMGAIQAKLINRSSPNLRPELPNLLRREFDTFCVADHHDYAILKQNVDALMTEFFEGYFPIPAPWELDRS